MTRMMSSVVGAVMLLGVCGNEAKADSPDPLAQQTSTTTYNGLSSTAFLGQYIVTQRDLITQVRVALHDNLVGESVTLTVYRSSVANGDPDTSTLTQLATQTIVGDAVDFNTASDTFDFSTSPIDVSAINCSQRILLELSTPAASDTGFIGARSPGDAYFGSYFSSFDAGASWTAINQDLHFSVWTTDRPSPGDPDPLAQQLVQTTINGISSTAFVGQYVVMSNDYLTAVDVQLHDNLAGESVTMTVFSSSVSHGDPDTSVLTPLGSKTILGDCTSTGTGTVTDRFEFDEPIDVSAIKSSAQIFLQLSPNGGDAGWVGVAMPDTYTAAWYYTSTAGASTWAAFNGDLQFSVFSVATVPAKGMILVIW